MTPGQGDLLVGAWESRCIDRAAFTTGFCFAAAGSWLGAFASITFLHRPPGGPPVGAAPE